MASFTRYPFACLAAFSLLQLWPYVIFDIGGDSLNYQFYMECFSRTLLEGEIRPSWCRFADGGFGTPLFFFYFPLPYYIATIFYPLTFVGVTIEQLFILQVYIANVLFAALWYVWLKRHVSAPKALLVTCLLMFVPYRLELLFYRAAHAELFAIALLPLWLMALEKLMVNIRQWHALALIAGITAITHAQMSLIFGIISLSYALFYTKQLRVVMVGGFACLFGIALAAYFLIPAAYYQQFILGAGTGGVNYGNAAVNRYLVMEDLMQIRVRLVILSACSLLAVVALWIAVNRPQKEHVFSQHITAWTWTFLLAALLYSPLIAPLFDNSQLVRSIFFPWRMQVVFIPVFAILLVAMCLRPVSMKKTFAADICILLIFLNLLQLFAVQVRVEGQEEKIEQKTVLLVNPNFEYYSLWTPTNQPVLDIITPRGPLLYDGEADITNYRAYGNVISMDVDARAPSVISLHQAYFPSWRASTKGAELTLQPDTRTGDTLINVPKGVHHVVLAHHPYSSGPFYVRLSPWLSLAALLYLLYSWQRRKKSRSS